MKINYFTIVLWSPKKLLLTICTLSFSMSCGMVRFKLLVSLAGFSIFSVDRMLSVKSCVDQIYVQRRTPEPNLYHLLTRGTVPRYPIYSAASFKGASYCWPQKQHWKKIENGYPCNLVDGSWFLRCSAVMFVPWALAEFLVHVVVLPTKSWRTYGSLFGELGSL